MLLYTQFSYKTTRKVFRTIFTSFINNFKSIRVNYKQGNFLLVIVKHHHGTSPHRHSLTKLWWGRREMRILEGLFAAVLLPSVWLHSLKQTIKSYLFLFFHEIKPTAS